MWPRSLLRQLSSIARIYNVPSLFTLRGGSVYFISLHKKIILRLVVNIVHFGKNLTI